jgi:SAM-dependent methyltransferase
MSGQHALEFRALVDDRKFQELSRSDIAAPLDHEIAEFIARFAVPAAGGGPARIMDFGCGRGRLVGQLRLAHQHAYGVDIDPRFIRSGALLSNLWKPRDAILSATGSQGRTIFPDGFFDAVITDQVLEHVADLDGLAAEISRILKPGGVVFNRFPGRRLLIEPHYFLPAVHWLPAHSRRRRLAIRAFLHLGLGVRFSVRLPLRDKARVIAAYADTHTFYRPAKVIRDVFARHGIALSFGPFFRWWLLGKLHSKLRFPGPLLRLAATLLRSRRLTHLLAESYHWRVTGKKIPRGPHPRSRPGPGPGQNKSPGRFREPGLWDL